MPSTKTATDSQGKYLNNAISLEQTLFAESMLFKVREYHLKLVGTLLGPCRSTTKRVEVEQTHTQRTDYRNPAAHAPRVKYALRICT